MLMWPKQLAGSVVCDVLHGRWSCSWPAGWRPTSRSAGEFDQLLRELVRIRAAQINGCAYCIDMHTKDARATGESEQRLYALSAWRETPFYTDRERAALAFTEAVTLLADDHVPTEAYEAVARHLTEDEIAALVSLIVAINAWNAIGVSTRAWTPGSYEA